MARVVAPGVLRHLTERGVRAMDVFFTDGNRSQYLRLTVARCAPFHRNGRTSPSRPSSRPPPRRTSKKQK